MNAAPIAQDGNLLKRSGARYRCSVAAQTMASRRRSGRVRQAAAGARQADFGAARLAWRRLHQTLEVEEDDQDRDVDQHPNDHTDRHSDPAAQWGELHRPRAVRRNNSRVAGEHECHQCAALIAAFLSPQARNPLQDKGLGARPG